MQGWLAGPRANLGLTEGQIKEALSLAHGPKVKHRVTLLNSSDVPTGVVAPVDQSRGGSVDWSYRAPDRVSGPEKNTATVRRTASLTLTGNISFNLLTTRFQLTTYIQSPTGVWIPWDMGVFVSALPGVSDDGLILTRELELADKTFRYARPMKDTTVILNGTVVTDWLKTSLTTQFGETRFNITTSTKTMVGDKVFEPNTPWIEAYNEVLTLIGYDQLITDEIGVPTARPLSDLVSMGPEHVYEPGTTMMTAGKLNALLPTLPNVVRFVSRNGPSLPIEGNGWVTKYNNTVGPGSITQRGGEEVWLVVETDAFDQPTLQAIADADAQRYFAGGGLRYEGQVGLNPRHSDRDVNAVVKPRLGLTSRTDAWWVTQWSYPLREITEPGAVLMDVTWERKV